MSINTTRTVSIKYAMKRAEEKAYRGYILKQQELDPYGDSEQYNLEMRRLKYEQGEKEREYRQVEFIRRSSPYGTEDLTDEENMELVNYMKQFE